MANEPSLLDAPMNGEPETAVRAPLLLSMKNARTEVASAAYSSSPKGSMLMEVTPHRKLSGDPGPRLGTQSSHQRLTQRCCRQLDLLRSPAVCRRRKRIYRR